MPYDKKGYESICQPCVQCVEKETAVPVIVLILFQEKVRLRQNQFRFLVLLSIE